MLNLFVKLALQMAQDSHKSAYAVRAQNLKILFWHWKPNEPSDDFMVNVSHNSFVYHNDPYWLQFFPFIKNLAPDYSSCTINATPFSPVRLRIKEECFFLGGVQHFGHLIGDHLPRLKALRTDGLPRQLPIIVTHEMSDWEREMLSCMGFIDQIVELKSLYQSNCTIIEFDNVWIADGFSMWTRFDFLHSIFSKVTLLNDSKEEYNLPSRIYIARLPSSQARIINVEEIHNYVKQRGFTIVYGENLSIYQKIELFGQATIMIT